ncbi:RNA polymerase factor sigma-54 [Lysinibacillus sp. BW-2-10]|uniref:RNA polymerase factor sigma-54 n=1 Tax=Lysinibacillus sp. BW-2-10 TaxID=2590030 RepID=UPI00118145CD|nr:RNA polymerase factor sigma-54 [Lysinibacillus sp. BW-2-10]TSI08277.1 RNA polymerase factor sigma-54 [Lysinibacillus sp. BW-2-10]
MDLSMQQQQKLDMKLALTPQIKQSLEILKFSMEELENFIREEANSNPLIELKEPSSIEQTIEMARLQGDYGGGTSVSNGEALDPLNQVAGSTYSLELHLLEQLAMEKGLTRTEKEVIVYFIQNVNEVGYLVCDLEEVAFRFDLSVDECEKLLQILQSYEPVGIGARNLTECLLIQLNYKKDAPPLAAPFVQHHLEQLANREFQELVKQYETTIEEVQSVLLYIQQLNPYPMIEVEHERTEYIVPDLIVELLNGEVIIRINDVSLPQLSINTYYEELLRTNRDEETNHYLKTKLSDALLLMRGIEQRHETIYKITNFIFQRQKEFLVEGRIALKPLRLKDIAQLAELHESTVSRAIHDKFIQTPKGIFPMKEFFVRGIKTESGEIESTILIKEKIKTMIEQESKPLSDQKIANILMAEGIRIARRTVAKYREELGFLQSTKRAKKE